MALEGTEKLLGEQRIEDVRRTLDAHIPDIGPSKEAARNAAVAMVISDQGDRGLSALFIQRAEHPDDPWSGQMAFPGGRCGGAAGDAGGSGAGVDGGNAGRAVERRFGGAVERAWSRGVAVCVSSSGAGRVDAEL